jgi:starch phosphorylase
MAVLAIKLSRDVNAVSKLHREVVKKLWENLLEQESFSFEEDRPAHIKRHRRLASVTNGIHIPSWISDSMADVYDQYLGNDWKDFESSPEMWSKVTEIPSEKLWKVRCQERAKFVEFVRVSCSNHSLLDPDALTIGFARRFATYKRATLALSDRDRLVKLLSDTEKPVQFVFSGKAHPRDNEGKKVMQEVIRFSKSESARFKVAFLPDYDISKTKRLVHGVDLWLNNPRRPLEACGTSGMKVLANGGLNASVLDGWWDEAYSPSRGWSIGTNTMMSDAALQDKQDSESLYDVLEHHIIPEFYDRTSGVPMKWVERMKHSISKLCPQFNTNRMLIDYSQHYYFRDTN